MELEYREEPVSSRVWARWSRQEHSERLLARATQAEAREKPSSMELAAYGVFERAGNSRGAQARRHGELYMLVDSCGGRKQMDKTLLVGSG